MVGLTIATRVLEELRRSSLPLDDDDLADRLGVRPRQTINQVCRLLERSGQLRRYPGPEGKIVNAVRRSSASQCPPGAPVTAMPSRDTDRPGAVGGVSHVGAPAWPGHPATATYLYEAGFRPLELRVTSLDVELPAGRGCEWTTIGEVPDGPGLYAFTVEDDAHIRVTYVGLTEHLWMVTKGRLPGSGGARRPALRAATARRCNPPARQHPHRRTAALRARSAALGSHASRSGASRRRRAAYQQLGPAPRRLESRLTAGRPSGMRRRRRDQP
jgi:hypothetical protein